MAVLSGYIIHDGSLWQSTYNHVASNCFYITTVIVLELGIMNVRRYVDSIRRLWNSMAIKHMQKWLKPGLFSFSSGLGIRLKSLFFQPL